MDVLDAAPEAPHDADTCMEVSCEECRRQRAHEFASCDRCGHHFHRDAMTPCFTEADELDHYLCPGCMEGSPI